jgi:putative oxidoreductase
MNSMNPILALIGRLLFALMFIPAGFSKISGFGGTVGYIASAGLPAPTLAAIGAIVVEVGCGIAIALGFKTRVAALILAAFTLVASVFFHAFWGAAADQQFVQQLMFFKNLAIVGGLLVLAAQGAGALSVDAKRAS